MYYNHKDSGKQSESRKPTTRFCLRSCDQDLLHTPPSLPPSLHEQDTFEHLLDLKADLNCLTNYLPIYTKV